MLLKRNGVATERVDLIGRLTDEVFYELNSPPL